MSVETEHGADRGAKLKVVDSGPCHINTSFLDLNRTHYVSSDPKQFLTFIYRS